MTDRVPELPEFDTAVLAKLVTLGDVVDYMNEQLTGDATSIAATASSVEAATAGPAHASPNTVPALGRFVLEAVAKPAQGLAQAGVHGQGHLWVTNDGSGLASELVAALGRRGIDAVAVDQVPEVSPATARGLIFLGGLSPLTSIDDAIGVNRKAFDAAKKLAPTLDNARPCGGLFVTVQDTGGAFGTTAFDGVNAWCAGPAALARTVAQEWPGVAVKAIDVERGVQTETELAEALANELTVGGPDLNVGLGADGIRRTLRSKEIVVENGRFPLADGDVVVCSGGGRGVTAATMIELAGRAHLRFALLGRSVMTDDPDCCRGLEDDAALKKALLARAKDRGDTPTPVTLGNEVAAITASRQIRATLAAIQAAGSDARYLTVDVTDAERTSELLKDVREQWGEISAIVHGAGVLADKAISAKTVEQFDRVFDTKISGLRSLLAATAADRLKLICLFSSVAARCGNVGQCDYAMANEILNKVAIAESRRRQGACLVRSLGWGPWEGGMVSPQLRKHFQAMGVPLIPLDTGARMFVDECSSAQPDQVELVLGGQPQSTPLADPDQPRTLRVDVMVGRDTHPYLGDHAIHGVPVVPVAWVLEWFARTARAFAPDLELAAIRDVNVIRGVALDDFDRVPTKLVVQCHEIAAPTNTNTSILQLELGDGNGTTYYRCAIDMAEQRATPKNTSQPNADLSLEAWNDDTMYDGHVLFHGPDFQMLQNIDGISDRGIVAELTGVLKPGWSDKVPSKFPEPWCTDPLIFDASLQLALLWGRRVLGGPSLPTSIARVQTFDDPTTGPFRCTLQGRSASGNKAVSDAIIHDVGGRVVAEIAGIETHLLPKRA